MCDECFYAGYRDQYPEEEWLNLAEEELYATWDDELDDAANDPLEEDKPLEDTWQEGDGTAWHQPGKFKFSKGDSFEQIRRQVAVATLAEARKEMFRVWADNDVTSAAVLLELALEALIELESEWTYAGDYQLPKAGD